MMIFFGLDSLGKKRLIIISTDIQSAKNRIAKGTISKIIGSLDGSVTVSQTPRLKYNPVTSAKRRYLYNFMSKTLSVYIKKDHVVVKTWWR